MRQESIAVYNTPSLPRTPTPDYRDRFEEKIKRQLSVTFMRVNPQKEQPLPARQKRTPLLNWTIYLIR